MQDFPFYNSKTTNFERLYDLRIKPMGLPLSHLSGEVAKAYANLRRDTLEYLRHLRWATNTQSYDRAYYRHAAEYGGRFATSNTNHYCKNSLAILGLR